MRVVYAPVPHDSRRGLLVRHSVVGYGRGDCCDGDDRWDWDGGVHLERLRPADMWTPRVTSLAVVATVKGSSPVHGARWSVIVGHKRADARGLSHWRGVA